MSVQITVVDRHARLAIRLQEKLERIAQLRCDDHGLPVTSVVIHARENGWFDSRWTTCCEILEGRAVAILGIRY